jgi:phenylpropionate dioxygenase-like ring-hydroxylating dioxygenase large terminal subunit
MDQATNLALIDRILGNLEAGRREEAAALGGAAVADYVSAERDAWEREALFRRAPLILAHGGELPAPGDFVTHDLAGVPVLLARGREGRVRAFLNVCRHRGSRLVAAARGGVRRGFTCPYHAWAYGLDGRLSGTGDESAFAGLDLGARGLVELPAAERHGLVWVRPSPARAGEEDGAIDMDGFLGGLALDFAAWGLAETVHHAPEHLPGRMNWKVMVDTFLEDTHFRWVHGESVHRYYLDNASIYDRMGPHVRYVIPKRTITGLPGTDRAGWRLREHANVLYHIFPNTVIVFVTDHAAIFAMFPAGAEESVMRLSFCLPVEPEGETRAYWDRNLGLIRDALAEDFAIAEGVQRGFRSGANQDLVFGRYEKGLIFFHAAVEEALRVAE